MKFWFAVLLICCSCINYGQSQRCNRTCNRKIMAKEEGSAGVPSGDLMIQRITTCKSESTALNWDEKTGKLFYTDGGFADLFTWTYDKGAEDGHHVNELNRTRVSFWTPIKDNDDNKALLGTNKRILLHQYNKTGYSVSTVLTLNDRGYSFLRAHTDKNGRMFITTIFMAPGGGGKLYKVENNELTKVANYTHARTDFAFSYDQKQLFMVIGGKMIGMYNYTLSSGAITRNYTMVFSLPMGAKDIIRAIETDNKNMLWIATKAGMVFQVQLGPNKKIVRQIKMPVGDIVSVTFGGYKNKNLFVGTRNGPKTVIQGGSIFAVTGINAESNPDFPVNYKV